MPNLELLEEKEETTFFEEDEDQANGLESSRAKRLSELDEIAGIVVAGTDWTTATVLDQLVRGNIQLNPRFQRRDAWNITRKSRFIESIILGFPIPQIVLASNEKERGKFIVLDGKQRLLTILQFYGKSETPNNKFSLKDLEFRPELNGCTHEDLENNLLSAEILDPLDNQTIRTTLIRNWHTDNFLYKIFLRLNVESTPLSPQELRQALHPGEFVNFLDDQSVKSQALRKILKSKNPDFRMRDVELLLRYVAFHYFLSEYRGNLKAFLDMTCEVLNKSWKKRTDDVHYAVSQFEKAVETTIDIFGEKNFSRMWLGTSKVYRRQFNRAILDVMVFYFSDGLIREAAEKNKTAVENAFKELCSSSENGFREAVEGTTKNIRETHIRLSLWGYALLGVLDLEFNLPELVDNRIIFNGLR
ncbi:DUF262 domain-containing protein [Phormidesmis priestleyi ULC007]|uniref:DUF262 domain-containing protein n=1 Tax=Phormidesmis priestleyi ULC007 TaxID=1920490 RepID=A0A2T1DIY7_9CYAN|nr:DUF262 domain-containing protein [Phormidesmis priestleyi]PSB20433.1 DUF262 domain-containing protein [Phormidesmis priestleyi ULC007]PZO50208.1 MAG: DUF262 domain-containing protein [Phormidesmis priestleyi]